MSQNANKSGIFGHSGGNMLGGGIAREKNYFFSCPHRPHVFSKKGGIVIITFEGKVFILGKNACEDPYLK